MRMLKGWVALFVMAWVLPAGSADIKPVKRIEMSAISLHVDGDVLYVGGSKSLRIYDIGDRANPSLRSEMEFGSGVVSVATVGTIAVVGLEERDDPNLIILDVSNLSSPKRLFERRTDQQRKRISILRARGRHIYVGLEDMSVQVVELNDSNDIKVIIGSLPVSSVITDIRFQDNRVFIATWDGFMVVDITDPANMRLVKTVLTDSGEACNGLSLEGGLLAISEGFAGITFYDIANPDDPKKIKTVAMNRDSENGRLFLREDFCYVATYFGQSDYLEIQGGLRILDCQIRSNIKEIFRYDVQNYVGAVDVIAYDGYVYLAEDEALSVFKHGPVGVRPTATPIVPTNTPTPTNTATPTNTPPLLVTPTRPDAPPTATFTPMATFTPTFTHTPVQPIPTNTPLPSVPTPTPTRTSTPVPMQPTPTSTAPSGSLPAALFTADFDGPLLAHEQFVAQLPFAGSFTLAQNLISAIPTDNAFPGATNGRGVNVTLNPGNAVLLMGPYVNVEGGYPALLRVSVRSTGGGASIALAAMDGSFDGSVATNIPADSKIFNGAYKRMVMVYKAPSNGIVPLLQAVAGASQSGPVTVYFDNFELIPLPPGTSIPSEALGADGTAP